MTKVHELLRSRSLVRRSAVSTRRDRHSRWLNVADRRTRVREKLARAWLVNVVIPRWLSWPKGSCSIIATMRGSMTRRRSASCRWVSQNGFASIWGQTIRCGPVFWGTPCRDSARCVAGDSRARAARRLLSGDVGRECGSNRGRGRSHDGSRRAKRWPSFIARFVEVRFLWDYLDNGKLVVPAQSGARATPTAAARRDVWRISARGPVNGAARVDELITPPG